MSTWSGKIVAGRFATERQVGSGGMGTVYLATDQTTGKRVALKVFSRMDEAAARRFEREARTLAELHHPAIVAYVDHGRSEEGQPYLAMEWLEGDNLATILAARRLEPAESIALVHTVAGALGFAHQRNIVHRDVKPGNLVVPGGDVRGVKLVDFGIARVGGNRVTLTGVGMGTPAYTAPEQARAEPTLGPAADVFSLGCVLFECLSGRPAFVGDHIVAILAKILFEEPPRLAELWSEVPEELDELVASMLEKEPDKRPRDGIALLPLLERTARVIADPSAARSRRAIGAREARFCAAVVIGNVGQPGQVQTMPIDPKQVRSPVSADPSYELVRTLATEHGGRFEPVRGRDAVVLFTETAQAVDGACRAARCALAVRELVPHARLGVAMAHAPSGSAAREVGRVLERAADLLEGEVDSLPPSLRRRIGKSPPVMVDEVAAGFLDVSFVVAGAHAPYALVGERSVEEHRTLLGRRTSCVGRETELRTLEAMVHGVIDGPAARAVLVTGPAGAGKSRLRVELVRRLRNSHDDLRVWLARGEQGATATPFGLLAQIVLRLAGSAHTTEARARQRKLIALVAQNVPAVEVQVTAEFLGELIGADFPDAESVPLRTARADPIAMGDQIRRAWDGLVRGAASRDAVLLILEDVHWADAASMRLIAGTLQNLADLPIAVVATARPEGREQLPPGWAEGVLVLPLPALGKKAVAQLCAEVLGDGAMSEEIARLAGGNAFHIEELIRTAAAGAQRAPLTVVAMLQARLGALDPELRLVARAASVHGEAFDADGVAALLGDRIEAARVREHLLALCDKEILEAFPGAAVFRFRHALLHEAAYGTLTEEDRRLAHRLAGSWLERAQRSSAAALAEHFDRGGEPTRALRWYVHAAERALEAHDLGSARRCVARGLACGATGTVLGTLRAVEAEALEWQGDLVGAEERAIEAMARLPAGSPWWARATAPLLAGKLAQGQDAPATLVEQLVALPMDRAEHWVVVARTAAYLVLAEKGRLADPLIERLATIDAALLEGHPRAAGWAACTRSLLVAQAGDMALALAESQQAERMLLLAGDLRTAAMVRFNNSCFLIQLGDHANALELARDTLERSTQAGWTFLVGVTRANCGLSFMHLGRLDEAGPALARAEDELHTSQDRRMAGTVICYRAWLAEKRGQPAEAVAHARRAIEVLVGTRPRSLGLATLAHALLAGPPGDHDREALTRATEALETMTALGGIDEGEAFIRLTHVEAVARAQGRALARDHLMRAAARLSERASRILDPALRRSFLENVPENARTLALASGGA